MPYDEKAKRLRENGEIIVLFAWFLSPKTKNLYKYKMIEEYMDLLSYFLFDELK